MSVSRDYFAADAFGVSDLSDLVLKAPFRPRLIQESGWFDEAPIFGTRVDVESLAGVLTILPVSARCGADTVTAQGKRTMNDLKCPHISERVTITVDDINNVSRRGEATETDLLTLVGQRLAGIRDNVEATIERHRLLALIGVIAYEPGDVTGTKSLFTEFGTTEDSVDFVFGTATTDMHAKFMSVVDKMYLALGDIEPPEIVGLCHPTFFDTLVAHAEFKKDYRDQQMLLAVSPVGFARPRYPELLVAPNIRLIRYGAGTGMTAKTCRFFVPGAGLLKTVWGASDLPEDAGNLGSRIFIDRPRESENGKQYHVAGQSNGLHICTRPRSLILGHSST